MEQSHARRPIGFTIGNTLSHKGDGVVDPILMNGEGHLITIAPTGAGKGVGCIIPALLRHVGPVIVVDPKGENAAVTSRRRREMGDEVVVLDPMNLTGEMGGSLNPLDLIDAERATGVDDAAALVGTLLPEPCQAIVTSIGGAERINC
ncbi:type IV secretory system conjugative DNA transfer family protein [Mesorhizobium escarrei]|uniref:Type IV secretion system protein VirD4 n=1 Tax=Mesorhizobium escarrei TaxID=666018 RepID=A0ABM9E8U9_9HYPH|nr:type IV secretory system conjugative DNA transfer family protein [Mesorhizobium escarrei]CAH2405601.1 Type IV secretion system protein VirD4 [Mesorhizobium escarrei]